MKIMGTTKLTKGQKISLIKDVREKLQVEEGDKLVYKKDEEGRIIIEKT